MISLVQSKIVSGGINPGVIALAFDNPVTAGNLIVAIPVSTSTFPGAPIQPTDTAGNLYGVLVDNGGFETPGFFVMGATANASGALTVSVDFTGASQGIFFIAEFSGINASAIIDQTNKGTLSTGAIATTHAAELIIAGVWGQPLDIDSPAPLLPWAVDSGFTIMQSLDNDSATKSFSFSVAYFVAAVIDTFNVTFTPTAAPALTSFGSAIVALAPVAASPTNKLIQPQSVLVHLPWGNRPISNKIQKDFKGVL
jgi:hypothetical protein